MQMRIRTGVDLMRIARIEHTISRFGDRFIRRIFTDAERQICGDRVHAYAARWAAKEAIAKLLGTGLQGIGSGSYALPWRSIEIQRDAHQKPVVHLHGRALHVAHEYHIHDIDVSLSHDGEYVVASAVALIYNNGERPS